MSAAATVASTSAVTVVGVVAAAVAAISAVANWWSRVAVAHRLASGVETVSKPVVTVAIAVLGVDVAGDAPTGVLVAGVVGFVLCLVGDVALLPAVDRFVVGLGSFLAGHVAFVVMFAVAGFDAGWWAAAAVALVAVGVAAVAPRVVAGARARDRVLGGAVVAYLAVISVMVVAAWATGVPAAMVGAALFLVSDAVLAWRMFVGERRWMAPTVMITYHGALLGLAVSMGAFGATAVADAAGAETLHPSAPPPSISAAPTTASTTGSAEGSAAVPTVVPAAAAAVTTVPAPSTVPATTTTTTTTTIPLPAPVIPERFPALTAALATLRGAVPAFAATVWVDGTPRLGAAVGTRLDGVAVGTDTPFVVASVSKILTALTVARLDQAGLLDVDAPVPWTAMGVAHDPAWADVTPRELMAHTSGMPTAQPIWLDLPGPCAVPLAQVMAAPPTEQRGEWVYSNGNYCALGMLVEHATGARLQDATAWVLFGPAGVRGPSLSTSGPRSDMAPYPKGIARLDRLGGAGAWIASPDAIAAVVSQVTAADRALLGVPVMMADQYGWGHSGTVDGTRACAWTMTGHGLPSEVVLVAVVAGMSPASGAKLCDLLVPALGADLGLPLGDPARLPV